MKKINKWIVKQDTLVVIIVVTFILLIVAEIDTSVLIKNTCTIICIPILLYLVQNLVEVKRNNDAYNVDLYLKENNTCNIIWKCQTINYSEEITYVCIKNIGAVNIFPVYLKILKEDGKAEWYVINDKFNINEERMICIPDKIDEIKEVWISCGLQSECRTKKYNGIKSGNSDMIIFSNVEVLSDEKYAVVHEKGTDIFKKMERFVV